MIISHSKKYIFIHCPKSAGTSVSVSLAKHTGEEDIVTPHEHLEVDHDYNRAEGKNKGRYTSHSIERIEGYLHISTKRNPFDQIVSNFYWHHYPNFEEYVINEYFIDCRPYWTGMDYYLDFHKLDLSYQDLCGKLGIPYERLPRTKSKVRKTEGYRDMYTDQTREKVEEFYKDAIKLFNYDF